MNESPDIPNIEELLKSIAPPNTPDESFETASAQLKDIENWHKRKAALVLAGLQTLPSLHANDIRLDWLQRLVLAKASGRKKPSPKDFQHILNKGLSEARVLSLEDPIEDTFCNLISTERGNYRVILGRWEDAAAYTQTVLDAFAALPEHALKTDALRASHALLALSDALCGRAKLSRGGDSGGKAMGEVKLGSKDVLNGLARRVHFRKRDLDELGIDIGALAPFFINEDYYPYVSDRPIGDTPLEFHPLLHTSDGVCVLSPSNLTIAVRAALINTALEGGLGTALQHRLLEAQERFSEETAFWPAGRINLSSPNAHNIRACVCQYDHGHYLHIVQIPTVFDGLPQQAFASFRQLPKGAAGSVVSDIEKFWSFLAERGDSRSSTTIVLLSGWGAPHGFAPDIDEENAPKHWTFLPLSFADAAVLGACQNGGMSNVLRLHEQVQKMERDGYTFTNPNGLLNLFSCWRETDGNIVPEHRSEMAPPCNLVLGVDEIHAPRMEALDKQDRQALPSLDGSHKIVQRKDWAEEPRYPIYASIEDAKRSRLVGAASLGECTIWVVSETQEGVPREWRYQIWNAILQWLGQTGPKILEHHPSLYCQGVYEISIVLPKHDGPAGAVNTKTPTTTLAETVTVQQDVNETNKFIVAVKKGWMKHLSMPENDAEVELVAAIFHSIAKANDPKALRDYARAHVRKAIVSKNWRWLHAREVHDPVPRLGAQGLIEQFAPLSLSAHALIKYGSVWTFRDRSAGCEVNGEDACRQFLKDYRDSVLRGLISDIRRFDRHAIVMKAANAFQAARYEQHNWRSTIRAQRAIRGEGADALAFTRQNEINAILRATKSICEVAACEAPAKGGLKPARKELDEMFAKALLLFGNGQLFAAIRGGLIKPELRISPCGDVLSERDIFSKLLEPSASWLNQRVLNQADNSYDQKKITEKGDNEVDQKLPWNKELRAAIEAEYGCSAEGFFDLQFAVLQMAEQRNEGIFVATHSHLCQALRENTSYPDDETGDLLQRLTLKNRKGWQAELLENQIDLSKFDRPHSLINRPLLALNSDEDPLVLVVPAFVSDAVLYAVSGLDEGRLGERYWSRPEARSYAGKRGHKAGHDFEERVANRLQELGLQAEAACKPSTLLNQKVPDELGDIDVFTLSPDKTKAWVIEAKDLNICRTEAEVASRLWEYRGRMTVNSKGKEKPDKLLRHLRRVQYMRENVAALTKTHKLSVQPQIRGLLIVDAPQPMNFHMLDEIDDADSAFLDSIHEFDFR